MISGLTSALLQLWITLTAVGAVLLALVVAVQGGMRRLWRPRDRRSRR